MRVDLDHLPEVQQAELARVRDTLMAEFTQAISTATQPWKRTGKILKIILFGSYARNDWVDEPENGYQSDFDLLVIVSHEDLTDIAGYWYIAEDKILHDPAVRRPVNIIVHTLDEVNKALQRGEYFWVDIVRDGVLLYELPQHALATPQPLTPADALAMAQEYFDHWLGRIDSAINGADFYRAAGEVNDAVFTLHQATERAYICYLLVWTLYFPRSHNIKFLRSLSEDKEPRLVDAWPRSTRTDRRRFELLKRAYVEARYSPSYAISAEDLGTLATSVKRLRDIVEGLCRDRLSALQS
ncbi:HEPN domain-containing protein [Sphingomonas sp.]|jgi:predicted nucleotidyltransferase|uniref:HEPN domain-containing protein n=1 Tax=Sphingomonas sp. TaxID=28214 RepID=UPI002EDA98B7